MGNQQGKGGLFQQSEKSTYDQLKDDVSNVCKCTLKIRIIGWIVCFCLGWLLSIITTIVFIITKNYTFFAILFSFGTILNISGSCFLATPKTQIKDMFKKTRWLISLIYIGSTIATIVLAVTLPSNLKPLMIITLVIQIISYYFYTLSFIPFGRKILKKICKCIFL